jgi:hypothetical protein
MFQSLFEKITFANCVSFVELPPRGSREGFPLRPFHWKGHHCRLAAQPSGKPRYLLHTYILDIGSNH